MNYIIMADIISSSKLPGQELMEQFGKDVEHVNNYFREKILSPLSITLGDEFQGVIMDLATALEIVFVFDQLLLRSDPPYGLRFIINYGVIDTPVNHENAYGMLGDGLTQARERLNMLKQEEREVIVSGLTDSSKQEMINMALDLYRAFYNDWKKDDRKVAAYFLELKDYKRVAETIHRDPSTVWRRERSLKMHEYYTARNLITTLANA